MELVEIRDLDGPNHFTLRPAIKIEGILSDGEVLAPAVLERTCRELARELPAEPLEAMRAVIETLHRRIGLELLAMGVRRLDQPGHRALFYTWEWRSTALAIAAAAVEAVTSGLADDPVSALQAALDHDQRIGDRPIWVRDSERRVPTVGITGTNGKTTTTRLIAHIARQAGLRAGWCSSTGVYIAGEQVLDGDYTGPTGARRVLSDPSVEVAILETARGGILLRGIAYESNDVGVMLNISADHLSLQGVEKIETLAEVKSVVVRVTRPDGLVVLNADDPLVLAQRANVQAPVLLTGQDAANPVMRAHVADGQRAVFRQGHAIALMAGGAAHTVATLDDVPVTFGGLARHMVENALAAVGAAVGLGLSIEQIAAGLRTFRPNVGSNTGRLNVFRLDGRTVVVDYAHNERGLEALLEFTERLTGRPGRLVAIIGTAGDRQDGVFRNLGRIAATHADAVYVKANPKYLRGRTDGEPLALMQAGVHAAGARARLAGTYPSELAALQAAIEDTVPGDAIAIMCVEEQLAIFRELRDRGAEEWQ